MQEWLSICIPTYKRPEHLSILLGKLENQLRNIEKEDVRVYISDNASGDNTRLVVNEFRERIYGICYHENETNIGMMRNFLKLFEIAKGEYVWLIGDDDEIVPYDGIEKVCKLLKLNNPDLLVFLDKNLLREGENVTVNEYISSYAKEYPHALLAHTWITSNIIRRSVFDAKFAENKLHTFYMHMYGIMKGLNKYNGSVFIVSELFVRPYAVMGYRDSSFPDLRDKWIEYFRFLASLFNQPKLNLYSKQWRLSKKEKLDKLFIKMEKYTKVKNYYFWIIKKMRDRDGHN
jgi:glycosyltransferase involved in cell wall biosynthesis